MAIEIVSFPIKNDDFPSFFVCLPEGSRTCPRPLRNRAPVHAVVHPPPRLERVDLRPSPIPGSAVVTVVGDGDWSTWLPPTKISEI